MSGVGRAEKSAQAPEVVKTVGCVERIAGEMVGFARSQPLGNATTLFLAIRATHHSDGTSVLHPPYELRAAAGGQVLPAP